jgi:hypothetical protein
LLSVKRPTVRLVDIWPNVLVIIATWCSLGVVSAQSRPADVTAERPVALVVRAASHAVERCYDVAPLQERIARHRGSSGAKAAELRFELQVDNEQSAELRVFRGDVLVSRRLFEHLPKACSELRDTVALSIALALEGVASDAVPANEAEDTTSGSQGTSGNATKAAARSSARTPDAARENEPAAREQQRALERPVPIAEAPPVLIEQTKPVAAEDPTEVEDAAADAAEGGAGLSIRLQPHLGGRVLVEALPAAVWAGALGVELWFDPHIAFDVSALASTLTQSAFARGRVNSRLVGAELLGCSSWNYASFAAQACLGATAAACYAAGNDYPAGDGDATQLWAATAARLALRWPNEGLIAVRLALQFHVNLMRPDLRVENAPGQQLRPAVVGGSLGLDVIVALE